MTLYNQFVCFKHTHTHTSLKKKKKKKKGKQIYKESKTTKAKGTSKAINTARRIKEVRGPNLFCSA